MTTGPDVQALIGRVVAACQADERVIALLVYGSQAAGTADVYSDLDIGVVSTDAAFEGVVAELDELVHAIGEPLLSEDFGEPSNRHVILADGAALEFLVARESEVRIEGPHLVLFDRTGVVARATGRDPAAVKPAASVDQVRRLVVGFWHDVEHLVTALGRGQTWWAYGQLDELRRMVLNLARLDAGQAIEADEAYWKVDEALDAGRLRAFEATVASLERGAIRTAAEALLREYRPLAMRLAVAQDLDYPTRLDRIVAGRLSSLEID